MHFSFLASSSSKAQEMLTHLQSLYPHHVPPEDCTVLIALGGDGFMLETLHKYHHLNLPVYGLNCGTIGFLMNQYNPKKCLKSCLETVHKTIIYPLLMTAYTKENTLCKYALNEVSLFRETPQAAKIKVTIDGVIRLEEYTGDGLMVATPAGSTAYNFSVHGPIIPLGANLLALTPISPFRPRRWRGALLPDGVTTTLEVLEPEKRPVSAAADHFQVRCVTHVKIAQDRSKPYTLLFDPDHNFETRILREQFLQ